MKNQNIFNEKRPKYRGGRAKRITFEKATQHLGYRAQHALQTLRVNSLGGILAVKKEEIVKIKGCGDSTWQAISDLKNYITKQPIEKHMRSFEMGEEQSSEIRQLEKFPLFSNNRSDIPHLRGLSNISLKLNRCCFPLRIAKIFEDLELESIRDLLFVPQEKILSHPYSDQQILKYLHQSIRDILTVRSKTNMPVPSEYRTVEELVSDFVRNTLGENRDSDIILRYMGISGPAKPSYAQIGREFNLCRERIRQIIRNGTRELQGIENLYRIPDFWADIESYVSESNELISINNLWTSLSCRYGWRLSDAPEILAAMLELCPALQLDANSEFVYKPELPCVSCDTVRKNLQSLISEDKEEMPVLDAGRLLAIACKSECSESVQVPSEFNSSFVEFMAKDSEQVTVEDGLVQSQMKWLLSKGEMLRAVVYAALETIGIPSHYTEIAEYIRQNNPKFKYIKDQNVHSCLCKYDVFQLTDRGVYGLTSWELKPYKSHSEAIIDLLERNGVAMRGNEIIKQLSVNSDYKASNLRTTLYLHPRINKIGYDLFDLEERVISGSSRTSRSISRKPPRRLDPAISKILSLITKNIHSSYRLVMLKAILDSRGEDGTCNVGDLASSFLEFYRQRQLKGLMVERSDASILTVLDKPLHEQLSIVERIIGFRVISDFQKTGLFLFHEGQLFMDHDLWHALKSSDNLMVINRTVEEKLERYFDRLD